MAFLSPARFSNRIAGGTAADDEHRKRNYDICQAIDTCKISIILDEMVAKGLLNKQMAEIYETQASVLRAAICSENNRAHNY